MLIYVYSITISEADTVLLHYICLTTLVASHFFRLQFLIPFLYLHSLILNMNVSKYKVTLIIYISEKQQTQ